VIPPKEPHQSNNLQFKHHYARKSLFVRFVGNELWPRDGGTRLYSSSTCRSPSLSLSVDFVCVFSGVLESLIEFIFCGQNDFIEEGAVTQVKGGKSIVPNVIRVVELARQRGILVIWVFSPFLLSFSRHGVVTCLRNLEKFWN